MKKQKKHVISTVQERSIAQELEIVPGDALLGVNGQPVEDVFDYRYLMNEEYVVLEVEKARRRNLGAGGREGIRRRPGRGVCQWT